MMLRPDWKVVMQKAWSIRLMVLAGVLSGCEAVLPLIVDDLPQSMFAGLSMVVISGAFVARLVAQREITK